MINRHKIYFDLVLNFLGHSKTPLHYPRKIKFTRDMNYGKIEMNYLQKRTLQMTT